MPLNDIDKFVKERLETIKPAYKEEAWAGIAAALDKTQKPASTPRGWIVPAASALAIITGTTLYFLLGHKTETRNIDKELTVNGREVPINGLNSRSLKSESSTSKPLGKNYSANILQKSSNQGIGNEAIKNTISRRARSNKDFPIVNSSGFSNHRNLKKDDGKTTAVFETNRNILEEIGFIVPPNTLASFEPGKGKGNTVSGYRKKGIRTDTYWENWQSIFYNFWDNAAYSGTEGTITFTGDNTVKLISNTSTVFATTYYAADFHIPHSRFGVGIYHERSNEVYSRMERTALALSGKVTRIGNGFLMAGVSAGVSTKQIYGSSLNWSDQIDPSRGFIRQTQQGTFKPQVSAVTWDAGLWYNTSKLLLGVDAQNVNNAAFGVLGASEKLSTVVSAVGGYIFEAGQNLQIMPWVKFSKSALDGKGKTMVVASWKNKLMIAGGLDNIHNGSSISPVAYFGYDVKGRMRFFTSYEAPADLSSLGIKQRIIHSGIRLQLK